MKLAEFKPAEMGAKEPAPLLEPKGGVAEGNLLLSGAPAPEKERATTETK